MASAYAWHPGSPGLTPGWGLPVALLPDEILSSWLVRAALVQGCDPLVLTGEVWPNWRVWMLDADRAMPLERLAPLSRVSGIPPGAFVAATLHPVVAHIQGHELRPKSVWPWVLTLGARNTRRRSGLQYCPACLGEDRMPYFRVQWRFAWHTVCPQHGCSLLDRCWNCGAAVAPHRLRAEDGHVAMCSRCKADLRNAPPAPCPVGLIVFQETADSVLQNGQGLFHGTSISAAEWFAVADFFVSLIRRINRSRTEGLMAFLRCAGVAMPKDLPAIPGAGIELLRVQERQGVLGAVGNFIEGGRDQLAEALKEAAITRQAFRAKGERVPASLSPLLDTLPDRPVTRARDQKTRVSGPRPRHEVLRMMARLERRLEILGR